MTDTGEVDITGYNTSLIDTHNSFNLTDGYYTIPEDGVYRVFVNTQFQKGDGDDSQQYRILKNGEEISFITINNSETADGIELTQFFECIFEAKKDDKISFRITNIDRVQYDRIFFGGIKIRD